MPGRRSVLDAVGDCEAHWRIAPVGNARPTTKDNFLSNFHANISTVSREADNDFARSCSLRDMTLLYAWGHVRTGRTAIPSRDSVVTRLPCLRRRSRPPSNCDQGDTRHRRQSARIVSVLRDYIIFLCSQPRRRVAVKSVMFAAVCQAIPCHPGEYSGRDFSYEECGLFGSGRGRTAPVRQTNHDRRRQRRARGGSRHDLRCLPRRLPPQFHPPMTMAGRPTPPSTSASATMMRSGTAGSWVSATAAGATASGSPSP